MGKLVDEFVRAARLAGMAERSAQIEAGALIQDAPPSSAERRTPSPAVAFVLAALPPQFLRDRAAA